MMGKNLSPEYANLNLVAELLHARHRVFQRNRGRHVRVPIAILVVRVLELGLCRVRHEHEVRWSRGPVECLWCFHE